MKPNDVGVHNAQVIWERLYSKRTKRQPKFNIGDHVRIAIKPDVFDKSHHANYSDHIYRVKEILTQSPPTYRLVNYRNVPLQKRFYEEEMVKTIADAETVYRIEKVLQKKVVEGGIFYRVKYVGYDNSYNQWIPESDFVLK
uniref:Chromo domain-containing protein n=1 Tax=Panagrolaimus sp. JU765 TaxID=591449 RepID=A0AC34QD60_9BILA